MNYYNLNNESMTRSLKIAEEIPSLVSTATGNITPKIEPMQYTSEENYWELQRCISLT